MKHNIVTVETIDFTDIGLTCGLEIHQQLKGRKLFSPASTHIEDGDPEYVVTRNLIAVAGETGEIDIAAAAEAAKKKQFVYQGFTSTSLVELDEQPPILCSEKALTTVLQLAALTNARVVDEVHVMRKTVVDGSNTSGFQRTSMVAYDGAIDVNESTVRIESLCLEEDSAKIVSRSPEKNIYNLSRLGIPLIEITTAPDLRTPEQVKACARAIGMLLRSTGGVIRGLGTIRQDVNVSVKKGNRVEIKGAQDLKILDDIVKFEACRQLNIGELSSVFSSLTVVEDSFVDVSSHVSSSKGFIGKALASGKKAFAVRVMHGKDVIGIEMQPGKRIGSDLSDYAKVHAGIGGIIHSDESCEKYGLTSENWDAIRKEVNCSAEDGFMIIISDEATAEKGFSFIAERVRMLREGVPKEVRRANEDGTTSYLRPMPGAARMYPETDLQPISPSKEVAAPELLSDREARYASSLGLSKDVAHLISHDGDFTLFDLLVSEFSSIKPATIAEVLTVHTVAARRKAKVDEFVLVEDDARAILSALLHNELASNKIVDVISGVCSGKNITDVLSSLKSMPEDEVRSIVEAVVNDLGSDSPRGKLMGEIMKRSNGRADGKLVGQILGKLV